MKKKLTVSVWNKDGTEVSLYCDVEEYEQDDEFIYFVGTIGLDHYDPAQCSDEEAKKLVGRTVNVYLPK